MHVSTEMFVVNSMYPRVIIGMQVGSLALPVSVGVPLSWYAPCGDGSSVERRWLYGGGDNPQLIIITNRVVQDTVRSTRR